MLIPFYDGARWSGALTEPREPDALVADPPWTGWAVAHWNCALLRHFFFVRPDSETGPISQLVVAPEEFARATGETEHRAGEVRDAFLSTFRQRVLSSGLLLGRDAKEAGRTWNETQAADPPFVAHLLLTCLLASDISDERAAEGNFRRRLDLLFVRHRSNHALEELPSLWRRFAIWLGEPGQRARGARELILPDVGHYRIIGIPLRLSFPPRRDELLLVDSMAQSGLLGVEPPVRAVLALIEAISSSFGERFRREFEEFRRLFDRRSPAVQHSPFWSAVRGAALAGSRRERASTGNVTLVMEPDPEDGGHFQLTLLLDANAAAKLPLDAVTVPLQEPIGDYAFAMAFRALDEAESPDDADRVLLPRAQARGRAWGALSTTIGEGVLLFAPDEDGLAVLAPRRPAAGSVDVLVRDELAVHLTGALRSAGDPPRHLESRYPRWREIRAVNAGDLASADFGSIPPLATIRCLQETLAPRVIHLSGGVRLDGGAWLGTPGFLPAVAAPDALALTLGDLRSKTSPSLAAFERILSSEGMWKFAGSTGPLDGEYELRAQRTDGSDATSVTFRSAVRAAGYLPPRPNAWITEGTSSEIAEIEASHESWPGGVAETSEPTWRPPEALARSTGARQDDHRDRVERLSTALAGMSLRRRGIPESAMFDIISTTFDTGGSLSWDILRSWVEGGALGRLMNRSWRGAAYFAVPPHFAAHRTASGTQATLVGLASPTFRDQVATAAASAGVDTWLDWSSVSTFTPPLLRMRAKQTEDLEATASLAGLTSVAWLASPNGVFRPIADVLSGPGPTPPKNYELFGHWSWESLRFLRGPDPSGDRVTLEWMRRPDAPDYYAVSQDGSTSWWGRSRVWAIHAICLACGRRPILELPGGILDCPRPGEAYLPVGVPRFAVALGAPWPGPLPSGEAYRYVLPSAWLGRAVLSGLWPDPRSEDLSSGLLARLRWIEATSRSRPRTRTVILPAEVRAVLATLRMPEARRLAVAGRVLRTLLPQLLDLVRRLPRARLD